MAALGFQAGCANLLGESEERLGKATDTAMNRVMEI